MCHISSQVDVTLWAREIAPHKNLEDENEEGEGHEAEDT